MPIGNIGKYTDRTRHYVRLSDGSVVTRATAENMYAQTSQGGGFTSQYARRQAYRNPTFRAAKERRAYQANRAAAEQAGTSPKEFEALTAKLYANPEDKSPDGPLAQWLTATGRRSANDTASVGETVYIR
jgi:hypothetical protein